jgi:hypothetical protein
VETAANRERGITELLAKTLKMKQTKHKVQVKVMDEYIG